MSFFENRYRRMRADFTTKVKERSALRVNTLKISAHELVRRLEAKRVKLEKIPWLQDGYWFEARFSLGSTPDYLQGHYYLQSAASQLVAEILDPQPAESVLDMAAAPGSKTTHLAQRMGNTGTIYALDENAHRLAALRNNCERLLARNVVMLKKDARFVRDLGLQFDRVLLDAPCSGNFCSEQDWLLKRRIEDVQANARVQHELLKAAVLVLKPGGVLVYSTCSLEPEEDELAIDWILKKAALSLEKIEVGIGDSGMVSWEGKDLHPSLALAHRFWPHRTGTEGFFIAKLRKNAE